MPDNFQFGSEHYLLVALDGSDKPQALTGRGTTDTVHFNNANWSEYGNVRDLSESQSNNSVNITTREDARQGLSVNVIATTEASMTFEIRYKPSLSNGTVQDKIFRALLIASRTKKEIAAIDLDRSQLTQGAQGQVGNWTVAMSRSKPVEGVVTASVTFNLSTFGDWIVAQDATGTNFHRMDANGDLVAQV